MLNALAFLIDSTPQPTLADSLTAVRSGTTSDWIISLTSLDLQPGDKVVAMVAIGSASDLAFAISGYVQLADLYANASHGTNLWVGEKVMADPVDTSITITGGTGGVANAGTAIVHVWRDAGDAGTVETATDGGTSGDADPPAIVNTRVNTPTIVCGATGHGEGSVTPTTGDLLEFQTSVQLDTNSISMGAGYVYSDGESFNPAAFTFNDGGNDTDHSWCAVCVALDG